MKIFKNGIFLFVTNLLLPVAALAARIEDPLNSNYSSIPNFISGALKVMVEIGLPVVALFLLIAGYKFAAAGGNPHKLEEAKENFVYVILGALLILGAWVLATLIGNTVTDLIH
jgi:hypothetical protein